MIVLIWPAKLGQALHCAKCVSTGREFVPFSFVNSAAKAVICENMKK
jgi:hypothetical protein